MPGALEKRQPAPEHDGRGQQQLDPGHHVGADRCGKRSRHVRHGKRQQRHAEPERDFQPTAHVAQFRVFRRCGGCVRGSRAMPQIGHAPGCPATTSGCMGQTYSVLAAGSSIVSGSSAMPHIGQTPGPLCRTSGSIGQMYIRFRRGGGLGRRPGPPATAVFAVDGVEELALSTRFSCGVTPVEAAGSDPGPIAVPGAGCGFVCWGVLPPSCTMPPIPPGL